MRKIWGVMTASLLAMTGCASEDALVQASTEGVTVSSDVDVLLMQADGSDDDGRILWEIREPDPTQADGGDDDGTVLWEIVVAEDGLGGDGTILWEVIEEDGGDDDGTVLWEIVVAEQQARVCEVSDRAIVDSATGRVLLEARSEGIYASGARVPSYYFKGREVFRTDGSVVLTASVEQSNASARRKLLIAALADGICGSKGLPTPPRLPQ